MAKKNELINGIINLHEDMNALSTDRINELAPVPVELEPQTKLTTKEIAKNEGVYYCEPIRKLQAFGKLPEKQIAEHKHDWEYVKGVYENQVTSGEPIQFWYSKYAGDPDCLWHVPANQPVYIPRMLAKHLETCQQYHSFSYIEKPIGHQKTNDFQQQFIPTNTFYRGKFRPIGAFS